MSAHDYAAKMMELSDANGKLRAEVSRLTRERDELQERVKELEEVLRLALGLTEGRVEDES